MALRDRSEMAGPLALTALASAYCFYAWLVFPNRFGLPLCPFLWITGIPCPLCGLTRSIGAFMRGHVSLAFYFNPVGPALLLVVLAWLVRMLIMSAQEQSSSSELDRQVM